MAMVATFLIDSFWNPLRHDIPADLIRIPPPYSIVQKSKDQHVWKRLVLRSRFQRAETWSRVKTMCDVHPERSVFVGKRDEPDKTLK